MWLFIWGRNDKNHSEREISRNFDFRLSLGILNIVQYSQISLLPREKKAFTVEKLWWRYYSIFVIYNDKISSMLLWGNDLLPCSWLPGLFDIDLDLFCYLPPSVAASSSLSVVSVQKRFWPATAHFGWNVKNDLPLFVR